MPDKKTLKLRTETRATGWGILSSVANRRLMSLLVIGIIIIIVAVIVIGQRKDREKSTQEPMLGMQVGQYYEKQKQCYQDADCPDGTFCNSMGMCVSSDTLPLRQAQPVLGRGRAGEGSTYRISSRTQGQN